MSLHHFTLFAKFIFAFLTICTFASCESKDNSYRSNSSLQADTMHWPESFRFGRTATTKEIDSIDIDVSPDGTGLPLGSGSVLDGKLVYATKCAICHGKTGTEGPFNSLISQFTKPSPGEKNRHEKTIGNYWPYATTLYDYINRAMPYNSPGTLTPDEVYGLTAFLLNANHIIDSTITLDATTLPGIVMPAQKLFVADDRQGGPEVK